jgi:HD-GYP domain-containing protein (c-di-GMP phosphodiesterase class II)
MVLTLLFMTASLRADLSRSRLALRANLGYRAFTRCHTDRVRDAVRLSELVVGLSVASDLGRGLDDGQGLRSCLLAMRLAEHLDLPADERRDLYWIALLRFVGCTATATEMAAALGDELATSAAFAALDPRELRAVLRGAVAAVGSRRPDRVLAFLAKAPAIVREHETASCEVAQIIADRLALPGSISAGLGQVFERWDGKGNPGRAAGSAIAPAVRVWQIAHLADLVLAQGGSAAEVLRTRAGGSLDPDLARRCADVDLAATAADADAVLAAEPEPHLVVSDEAVDGVLAVFGLVADLKAPCFLGHSEHVARLAEAAGRQAGRPEPELAALRRAGLVHDIGRVAVSAGIWTATGALSSAEREQIRLHPYYTGRVLSRATALRGLAELASSHHERCDGSGYHRGLAGSALAPAAGLLAAADAYVTAGEDRPHRAARSPHRQAEFLRGEAAAGRLSAEAVTAVLTAAGAQAPRAVAKPAGLTARELAVLNVVAEGLTNHAAGRRLGISAKTVNTHLEHIYAKFGVSTRAAAIVYAMQHNWLDPPRQRW